MPSNKKSLINLKLFKKTNKAKHSKKKKDMKNSIIALSQNNRNKNSIKKTNKEKHIKKKKDIKNSNIDSSKIYMVKADHSENKLSNVLEDHIIEDSRVESRICFEALIHPILPDFFFKYLWEKKVVLIKSNDQHFNKIFSMDEFDLILKKNIIKFTENLDIVSYSKDQRKTLNGIGRAHASVIWDYFQKGCSIRLLNPQTYSKKIWKILSLLQEYFSCMAGANIYLTPPQMQGFAPHWDDIEAFIIQLEGKKKWKIYSPRTKDEHLPRFSSENFTENEIGEPIFEHVLNSGDVLYFPRGFIHQACSLKDTHSLHITISVGQKNSWADFLENLLPRGIEIASEENISLRENLPIDYFKYIGVMHSDLVSDSRNAFNQNLKRLLSIVIDSLPIDATADQMYKTYLSNTLPPYISKEEKLLTFPLSPNENNKVFNNNLDGNTQIKLIRSGCMRIISEEKIYLYHNLDNSRIYEGNHSESLELSEEEVESVELLMKIYPKYIRVNQLLLETLQDKIILTKKLNSKGLLLFN